jgi:hypothetical protein
VKESCNKRIPDCSPYPKHIKRLFLILAAAVLALVQGCSGDQEITLPDFSKTSALERQETPSPDHTCLRVAVAAMISPKETFSYYRQLLDYIGSNIDRKVQLIQRKTYGEIKIDADLLIGLFKKYPSEGLIIMKRLTNVIGSRLVKCYQEVITPPGASAE